MSNVNCVCIIDDDKVYSYGVKKIINKNNLSENILVFNNGKTAFDELSSMIEEGKDMVDIILLDIDMPQMNGWEFLAKFEPLRKGLEKKIDIYVISSHVQGNGKDNGHLYKIEPAGAVIDFISKPIKPVDLQKIINDTVS